MRKKTLICLGSLLAVFSLSLFLATIVRRGNPPRTGIQMWYGPHPDIKSINHTWLVVDVERDSLTLEFDLYFKNREGNYSFWFLLPYETDTVDPRFQGATTKQEADARGSLSKKVILRGEYSVTHVFYVPNSTSYRYGTEHLASIQIDFHVRNLSVISEIGQHTLVLTFFGSRPRDLFISSESQLMLDPVTNSIPWDNVETMLYVKLPKGSYIRGESIPPITRYYFAESRAAMWLLDFQSPRAWLRNVAITVQCSYSSDSELLLKGILPAIASALMAAGVGMLIGLARENYRKKEALGTIQATTEKMASAKSERTSFWRRELRQDHSWMIRQLSSTCFTLSGLTVTVLSLITALFREGLHEVTLIVSLLVVSTFLFIVSGEMAREAYTVAKYLFAETAYLISLTLLAVGDIWFVIERTGVPGLVALVPVLVICYLVYRTIHNFQVAYRVR